MGRQPRPEMRKNAAWHSAATAPAPTPIGSSVMPLPMTGERPQDDHHKTHAREQERADPDTVEPLAVERHGCERDDRRIRVEADQRDRDRRAQERREHGDVEQSAGQRGDEQRDPPVVAEDPDVGQAPGAADARAERELTASSTAVATNPRQATKGSAIQPGRGRLARDVAQRPEERRACRDEEDAESVRSRRRRFAGQARSSR